MDVLTACWPFSRLSSTTLLVCALLLVFGNAVNVEEKRADDSQEDATSGATSRVSSASTRGPQYKVLPEGTTAGRATTSLPVSTTTEATREPNGDFVIKQGDHVCIRANFKVIFTVKYARQRRKSLSIAKSVMSMPDHVAVTGKCADDTALLTLTWANSTYSMTVVFNLQTKEMKKQREEPDIKLYGWGTASAAFSFDTRDEALFHHPLHPGKHTMTTLPSENYFFTPRNRSFSCTSRQRLLLNEYNHNGSVVKDDVIQVTLDLDSMRIQAFDMPLSGEFSDSASCDTDIYNNLPHQNVVPIIVAACLAGIIMIIIVAYFITKNLGQNPYKAMD